MSVGKEKKEFIVSKFQVKAADAEGDTGFISGLMSVFSNVDQGSDIVHPGAFAKTIQEKRGVVPFLLDHNPRKPAGYSTTMKETDKGLYYEAELPLFDPEVKQRYELAKLSLKLKTSMGNSFGYYAVKYDFENVETDGGAMMVRNLREVKLFEGSLVTFPMNEAAGVTDAKSEELLNNLLALIKRRNYDLTHMEKALDLYEKSLAAENEIDPVRQSVEAMKKIFS